MNILFFGDLFPLGRTYQRKRALEELGNSVTAHSLTTGDWFYKPKPSLLTRVLWKVGFLPDLTQTNKTILRKVQNGHFDIVWIEKGNNVWPRTLRAAKEVSPTWSSLQAIR